MLKDNNICNTNRYEALLQAIDFFTQKFNVKQLANFAFDFTNEILSLNSSALFVKNNSCFMLTKVANYAMDNHFIESTAKLQRIATFYGNVMISDFLNFFEAEDISKYNTKIVIPLIIQDLLYGFIISDGKEGEDFNQSDLNIAKALMQLINNALENSKNFSDLQKTNKQLDQKVFNLFSINQSSRMLLSELNLKRLYSLSIDIFSELTSSKITSFGIYDEIRDKIIIKGYKNVFSSEKYYQEYKLYSTDYNGYKLVFHYNNDKELLKEIFVNYNDFEKLEAEYIILIVKNKILGFVTISKPVNDRAYDTSLFELIESLAASTYISLTNAIFFQETNRQKKVIEQKLNVVTRLNSVIKNINSCEDIDELCDITIKTLHYGFKIKKAFISIRNKNEYQIKNSIGFETKKDIMPLSDYWSKINADSIYYEFTSNNNSNFFRKEFLEEIGESNCLIIAPLTVEGLDSIDSVYPAGYIVIFQTSESIKEEELLLVETIGNSISPIITHLNTVNQIKNEYMINQENSFITSLHKKFKLKSDFDIDFYIYYKSVTEKPFVDTDLSMYLEYEHFCIKGYVFVLSEVELQNDMFDGTVNGESVNSVIQMISTL